MVHLVMFNTFLVGFVLVCMNFYDRDNNATSGSQDSIHIVLNGEASRPKGKLRTYATTRSTFLSHLFESQRGRI